MTQAASTLEMARMEHSSGVLLRSAVICLTAFLTVVDLFATQAILPSLTRAYHVTPAAMGFAVNSSTMGMAVAGLAVSLFSQRIDRRLGILISLALLSVPTALLAIAPDLTTFTVLRIAQGLCMASAFTLTLAYLGEECSAADVAGAFAAYITGNVASNLIGRLVSAALADHLGLASNFYFFAALNLAGAVLVYYTIAQTIPMVQMGPAARSPFTAWITHLRNPRLRAAFGIGFCHPVRLHRHVHLRQLRPRAPTLVARPDGARIRLFRVPAVSRDDALGRPHGSAVGYPTYFVGFAGHGRRRHAAAFGAQSRRGLAGHGAHRSWDVFRPGDGHRLREPSRNRGPWLGQRYLSRLLLRRRFGRYCDPRSNL
jgi:MFS family permease